MILKMGWMKEGKWNEEDRLRSGGIRGTEEDSDGVIACMLGVSCDQRSKWREAQAESQNTTSGQHRGDCG